MRIALVMLVALLAFGVVDAEDVLWEYKVARKSESKFISTSDRQAGRGESLLRQGKFAQTSSWQNGWTSWLEPELNFWAGQGWELHLMSNVGNKGEQVIVLRRRKRK